MAGLARFEGESITLGEAASNHVTLGRLTFDSAGAVSIVENDGMLLSDASTRQPRRVDGRRRPGFRQRQRR